MPGPADPYASKPVSGELVDAAIVKARIDALFGYYGSIVNADIAAGAAILGSKLGDASVDVGKIGVIPACRAYHSADQLVATGPEASVAFNNERYDNDAIHDPVTNNTRLTCKTAGVYHIFVALKWASAAGTVRDAKIRLNGATYLCTDRRLMAGLTTDMEHVFSTAYKLAVNDYVEVRVAQDSGGNLALIGATGQAQAVEFGMHWVSRG